MDPTPEQRAIQESVRAFAAEELIPIAAECDATASFPEDAWDGLAKLDLTGMTVPDEYGGSAVDSRTAAIVYEELGAAMLAVGTALSVHCLATECIATFGDDPLRERWLPDMAEGRPVGAFALSEPGAGSNPAEMATVARRDGDEYVIDGEKQWITNGQRCGVLVLFAKTDRDDPESITQFLVETDRPGLTIGDPEEKLGLRASDTTALQFDDVRIPAQNRLTEEGRGLAAALSTLTGGRIAIAAQAVGLARAATEATIEYVGDREQFDRPIAEFQAVRHDIAEMHARVQASRLLTLEAARRHDNGRDVRAAAATAKFVASESAVRVAERAVHLHGGYGYTRDGDVERLYRDAKVTTIYEGTTEIQKTIIARALLD